MKRFLILLLVAVLAAQGTGMAQSSAGKTKTSAKSKVDGAIQKVLESATGAQNSSIQTARALGVPFDGNSLTVTVVFNSGRGTTGAVTSAVAQTFGSASVISSRSKTFVRLKLPVSLLPLLDTLLQLVPDIAYIRPPLAPQTLTVSEGVSLMGADQLHSSGTFGQGVKVAIIDLGFAGLSTARARGELPGNVITRDFTGSGLEFGTNHGTAVAEIAHDVAPNAQLYLMKIGDEIDLENAVNEAIAQGVDVINHSVGWFNTSYYDGTGVIASIAQTAVSAGILWVNSAGNYALRHYKGLFRDGNGNGWAEFSGSDESIDIQASAGETIHLYLTWRDWPFTSQDYDLALLNAQGAQVAISDKTQNGAQEPTETLRYFVPSSGTYRVQVQAFSGSSAKELTLFSLFHDLQHSVAQSSIVTPADVTSVLSVAAIRKENWSTGPQGGYSSQGPTNDGRPKPDITGPDNVTTSTFGLFEGTSAAAPHVAGAAALLLSQNPSMTGAQLSAQLRSTSTPVGSSLATGSGRVALSPPVTARPDLTILLTDFSPRTPMIGDLIQHGITVQNQGNAAAGSFVVQLQDGAGSDQRTVSSLAAGASTTISFSRTLGLSQDTVTVTVDSANQVTESNESNNTAQYQITGQTPPPATLPDLVVESMTANPQNPIVGGAFQLITVVRNQSSAAAGPFRVELQTGAGTSTQSISGLGAGAGVQLTLNATLSSSNQTFTVTADVLNQVQESNEGNNTRSQTVQAGAPPSSAPQGAIQTDKGSYQIGEKLRILFSTSARAYAYIYNVDASGRVAQVFPNSLSSNNLLSAGNYALPDGNYSFTVTGPVGMESVHLLLSGSPATLGLDGQISSQFTSPASFSSELQNRVRSQLGAGGWSVQSATFQVIAAAPATLADLVVESMSANPQNPMVGGAFQLITVVRNQGSAAAGPFRVELQTGAGTSTQSISGLGAGAGVQLALNTTLSSSRQTFTATADSLNQVQESNESNNTRSQTVQAGAPPASAPQGTIQTDKSFYQIGEKLRILFSTNARAYAYVYNVDASGRVAQVFPNSLSSNNLLSAGNYALPDGNYSFTVTGPVGVESVHLLLSASPATLGLDGQLSSQFTNPAVFSNELQNRVRSQLGSSGWSVQYATFQVTAAPTANQPPVAQFSFSPTQPLPGETVTFDATASFDPDGAIAEYRWDLNSDGVLDVAGSRVTARFNTARDYLATLTVIDNQGASSSASQTVRVVQLPANQRPTASFTFSPSAPQVGQSISFDASASRDPDGALVDYRWDYNSDGTVDAVGPTVSTQFNAAGTYRVTLTVLDNGGLSHAISQNVTVSTVPAPGTNPIPPGLMGIFIVGDTSQLHVVVQGDASWSSARAFSIVLDSTAELTLKKREIQGRASGNVSFAQGSKQDVTLSGSVGNGRVDFYFDQKGSRTAYIFNATIDADGNRSLDTNKSWVYIIKGNERLNPSRTPFVLVANLEGTKSVFPFPGTLYTCTTAFRNGQWESCVAL